MSKRHEDHGHITDRRDKPFLGIFEQKSQSCEIDLLFGPTLVLGTGA